MEDTFIKFEYEVKVDNTLYPTTVVCRGKSRTIEYPILRFDSTEKLTKDECYEIMKGTRGILSITGDFKEVEKSKYYTPEISEFHVGFEYERLISMKGGTAVPKEEHHEIWEKHIATKHEIAWMFTNFPNVVRTKYLDQKDIESFGFEGTDETLCNGRATTRLWKDDITIWFDTNFAKFAEGRNISISVDDPVRCKGSDNKFKQKVLFRGYVKNKSILEQILKMIGVDNG